MEEPAIFVMPDGRQIAHRFAAGCQPALVFLPGYMSDMTGSKASAMFDWAQASGRACLLLDYSGCGASSGAFAQGTLDRWCDEVLALIEAYCVGPVVLVGSSMGGWIMLLVAVVLGERVAAVVGIAAAPDFTAWGFSDDDKAEIEAVGRHVRPLSPSYEGEPLSTSRAFWRSGQANLLLGAPIALDCPVRLLHGQNDEDVPFSVSLRLAAALRSADVQVTLIKDGDHRLSRDADIALLLRTVEAVVDPTQ
jgi:pimeloyl-ACP methyl ester carboxylesterase